MPRTRNSSAHAVHRRISRGPGDRLWTYADFADLPCLAVAAALSRLTKKGVIRRLRKGVYYVPRRTRFGETTPEPSRVAAAVLRRRGISWKASGLPAYNRLGLTTQVSPTATFVVDQPIHAVRVGRNARIRIRRAAGASRAKPDERAVLDALRDLRWIPDASPGDVVRRVIDLFRSRHLSFDRVAGLARREPPRVRAILGAIGSYLGAESKVLNALKKSLNPMTSFSLGISEVLPTASEWNIR